ncbi:MAG: zinc ABC transporter substrate-binding protein [Verrucomicrobiales bacterium]|nr:zinc ABC transporter substrate-binding protein [Verrucomicrobiales bacterium]
MKINRLNRISVVVALTGGLLGCGRMEPSEADGAGSKPKVVVTTTMVSDLVKRVGGDSIELVTLMGPGVDPHSYKLPARSVAELKGADAVIYSGLHLEGRMAELFEDMRANGVPTLGVAETLAEEKLIGGEDAGGHADPHVWGDAKYWAGAIDGVVALLSEVVVGQAASFVERGEVYRLELEALDSWVGMRLAEVPSGRRVLVTSHDAFSYYGRAYGLEVVGLQGISTVDQASLAGMTKLVDLVKERGVRAIFVETSVNDAPIQRVAEDAGVRIGGTLFSDSAGVAGEMETAGGETYDVGTYTGMIKHNTNAIVEALK